MKTYSKNPRYKNYKKEVRTMRLDLAMSNMIEYEIKMGDAQAELNDAQAALGALVDGAPAPPGSPSKAVLTQKVTKATQKHAFYKSAHDIWLKIFEGIMTVFGQLKDIIFPR